MNRLRQIRKEKGLTQLMLAQRCGIGKSTIGNYEVGRTKLSVVSLSRLADALGVKPEEIELPDELPAASSNSWLVRESFAEYLAVTDLEKALDRAREARDWKAVCALGCELARKTEKETVKAEGGKP
jgi:transcriptional regulator with XRE-family HTH domain